GAANNQLELPEHGDALHEAGILYAPDFVINAGGLINVADELIGYDRERAMKKVEGIYRTLREVFRRSKTEGISPARAAEMMAAERIEKVSRVRLLWVPRRNDGWR
ncbi:MAG TPA: leucine dehydrogenase, partial [Actinomycetota bacterium]